MVEKRAPRRVPPGWPPEVPTPETEDWETAAAAWLLDLMPEYRNYPDLGRHPVVLAFIVRHVLGGAVEGARQGYRTTRSQLSSLVPPPVIASALGDFRAEGKRLSAALRSVELVERALRDS